MALARQFELIAVLDDHHIVLPGQFEKALAAPQRHGHRGRAMMRRGDIEIFAFGDFLRRNEPVAVDRERDHAIAHHAENIARVGVAWVLDADRRVLAQEKLRQHEERLLRPHGHDDLFRRREDAGARQDVHAQLIDQLGIIAVDEIARPVLDLEHAQGAARALAPIIRGEKRRIELPVEEGERVAQPIELLDDVALPRRRDAEALRPVGPERRQAHASRPSPERPRRRGRDRRRNSRCARAIRGSLHRRAADRRAPPCCGRRRARGRALGSTACGHCRRGDAPRSRRRSSGGSGPASDLWLSAKLRKRTLQLKPLSLASFRRTVRLGGEAPLGKAFASGLPAGDAAAGIPVPPMWADKHVIQAKAILWFYGRSKLLS